MTKQHTPGPWRVHSTDDGLVMADKNTRIASMLGVPGDVYGFANARLISKAPEMFDLLVDAVTNLDAAELGRFNVTTNDERKWREKAVALIAKVRGTQ
jgi:hypothetical protein